MASEISGLDPLHGYLKYGNLWCGCGPLSGSYRPGNSVRRAPDRPGGTASLAVRHSESAPRTRAEPPNGQGLFFE